MKKFCYDGAIVTATSKTEALKKILASGDDKQVRIGKLEDMKKTFQKTFGNKNQFIWNADGTSAKVALNHVDLRIDNRHAKPIFSIRIHGTDKPTAMSPVTFEQALKEAKSLDDIIR